MNTADKTIDEKTIRFILKTGKTYEPALLPKEIKRGERGKCFDWCWLQARDNPQYNYVEGLASNPEDPENYILHAWLTDGVHAFDPTWRMYDNDGVDHVLPVHYIGVALDMREVAHFMRRTGYQGVIANRWRDFEFFQGMKKGHQV